MQRVRWFDPGNSRTRAIAMGAIVLTMVLAAYSSPEPLRGTKLRPARDAAPVELQNQFGQHVSLTDHTGKVVVLTFLYTSCLDVCPIVTSQLRDTHELLGRDAEEVAFVAVSVDPERDSVPAVLDYSEKWSMTQNWDFLVGGEEELAPIWEAYYVAPAIDGHAPKSDGSRQTGGARGLKQAVGDRYQVIHSTPVYLIDRHGVMRVVFTPPLDPEDLVHDIRVLLD